MIQQINTRILLIQKAIVSANETIKNPYSPTARNYALGERRALRSELNFLKNLIQINENI